MNSILFQILAQKYGYTLPRIEDDPQYDMLTATKDPRQVFFGLEPGWVINLADQTIIKPDTTQSANDLANEVDWIRSIRENIL